jgi:methionyl aminopeptidase
MITRKDSVALKAMWQAGQQLAEVMAQVPDKLQEGLTTQALDLWIESELVKRSLVSQAKGYMGYRHATCISVNDEVVHGVPRETKMLAFGDLVKVDVCAAFKGYCADMARCFFVGQSLNQAPDALQHLVATAQKSLDAGIACAVVGGRLSTISHAIQQVVEAAGFGVVREFAGHGIGRKMHEEPEILNYGPPGRGPLLRSGMVFAIEPMITAGRHAITIDADGWTVRTKDGSMAAHVEDTVAITDEGPLILTRLA